MQSVRLPPPPMPPREAPPPMPSDEPEAKKPRLEFVLQPEDEFLEVETSGPAKVRSPISQCAPGSSAVGWSGRTLCVLEQMGHPPCVPAYFFKVP